MNISYLYSLIKVFKLIIPRHFLHSLFMLSGRAVIGKCILHQSFYIRNDYKLKSNYIGQTYMSTLNQFTANNDVPPPKTNLLSLQYHDTKISHATHFHLCFITITIISIIGNFSGWKIHLRSKPVDRNLFFQCLILS